MPGLRTILLEQQERQRTVRRSMVADVVGWLRTTTLQFCLDSAVVGWNLQRHQRIRRSSMKIRRQTMNMSHKLVCHQHTGAVIAREFRSAEEGQ